MRSDHQRKLEDGLAVVEFMRSRLQCTPGNVSIGRHETGHMVLAFDHLVSVARIAQAELTLQREANRELCKQVRKLEAVAPLVEIA